MTVERFAILPEGSMKKALAQRVKIALDAARATQRLNAAGLQEAIAAE
jgi:hypothetical protein